MEQEELYILRPIYISEKSDAILRKRAVRENVSTSRIMMDIIENNLTDYAEEEGIEFIPSQRLRSLCY